MDIFIVLLSICFALHLQHSTGSPILQNGAIGMFGDKFQGDIKLSETQKNILFGPSRKAAKTGWLWEGYRWLTNEQGLVIVPYRMNSSEGFSHQETQIIYKEFTIIEHSTCIRFVPRTTEDDFIEVINGNGCWSWLGRIGGAQELSLDVNGCIVEGIPMHEAIHALGYDHMQSHIDRDEYVDIMWENISPEFYGNFNKVDPLWFYNFGTPYDLLSVMHYPRWAFSSNGHDTIVPHDINYIDKIGSPHLSNDDALRLNRMYNCH